MHNIDPLVSVIVPICNVEKFLDQCLDSIEGQTYKNLEIICLNDGSKDDSLSIIKLHASKDNRIVVIDKENEGYGATCNRGLEIARGEYISIIEPDDYLLPTMYEDMVSFALSFEEPIDIVKCPWIDIRDWDDPKTEASYPCILHKRIPTSKKPFTIKDEPTLIETHPGIWSALYRRAFLNEKSIRFIPYPGAGWADNPFLIETMCQAGAIVFLDKAYYNYRTDLPGSTRNHGSDEAVARPFDRWIDMLHVLERLHVTDLNVIEAHYLRGFNYISGAIYDDGWGNSVVREKTHEVFSLMDEEIVLNHRKLHPNVKRFYLEESGKPISSIPKNPYRKYLISETYQTLRSQGFLGTLKRIIHHSPHKEPITKRNDEYISVDTSAD